MTTGDFKKPQKERNYVKSSQELEQHDQRSYAEHDQTQRLESAHASEDYSVKSDLEMSDEEILRRFKVSLTSNIIPTAPEISGYHLCWVPVHSNNHYDTVEFRQQVGYSVVKPEEVPKFSSGANRSGEIEGTVSHNELVLMKIPNRLYQIYMKDSHHTQPLEQERVIKQTITSMEDKNGESLVRDAAEMTGINSLARKVKDPHFN